ncbi:hypothetical protein B0T24DRAFT_568008 [Lasiosphaeria ovina]|uniref:Protein kinase domain-containing protein n=1 Tax=Lasiosphaeria ovina TaxID=92902 RepID=A0AAE0TYT5_9PEZI|nr:hypothetical protein B0T24DRAFT_568008 [Lasiosphaeria ovina]
MASRHTPFVLLDTDWDSGSLASSRFTTRLTGGAAPVIPGDRYANYDLIDTLALAQRLGVHFLPIAWQAPYRPLGRGRQAAINQTLVSLQTSLAFKSFGLSAQGSESAMQELINEMVVLSLPDVHTHPHIVQLQGLCWEVSSNGQVSPVLVFEKANLGNLGHFVESAGGDSALSLEDRLNLCVDIGIAVRDMHSLGILHGDLKPGNMLVFQDRSGKRVVKVTDFGYSTRCYDDQDLVKVPESVPWTAPEHHTRHFLASGARKMDIYSFGVVCLWLLFEGIPLNSTAGLGADTTSSFKDVLMNRANGEGFLQLSLEVVGQDGRFSNATKGNLNQFFASTLAKDANKRNSDLNHLLHLLVPNRQLPKPLHRSALDAAPEAPDVELFELESSFYEFFFADFRLRDVIAAELRSKSSAHAFTSESDQFTASRHYALQAALCYQVGFGVPRDPEKAKSYVENHGILQEELNLRVADLKDVSKQRQLRDGLFKDLDREGYLAQVCLAQYYRDLGQLEHAIQVRGREIRDLEDVLGLVHPFLLMLKSQLAKIFRDTGSLVEAELLETEVLLVAKSFETLDLDSPFILDAMANLALTLQELGRLQEAADLREEIVANLRSREDLGPDQPRRLGALANLASSYRIQGRWKQAQDLEIEVLNERMTTLGPDHVDTLTSKANLASTLCRQGEWAEAEKLEGEVVGAGVRALGPDHPLTITWMSNLSTTYHHRGRLSDALKLRTQVVGMIQRLHGPEHPMSLTCAAEAASLLRDMGHWSEAEKLLQYVVRTRVKVLGTEHPSTLVSMSNLASTFQKQGKLEDAEKLELIVIELGSEVLGKDHKDVLASQGNLAAIYRKQERFKEAEDLERHVLEVRVREFGQDHPDSLVSMANLGAILYLQGRYGEAEDFLSTVVAKREQSLGHDHPSTLLSRGNLSLVYQGQKRWAEAEVLERQVFEARKALLGEGHPDTLTALDNLAMNLKAQGLTEEAAELISTHALHQQDSSLTPSASRETRSA